MNYYMTLGISPYASSDEVRQAYLALAKQFHPDKNKSADATTVMAEINLAYETLCDSQRRKEYDLQNGIAAAHHVLAGQYNEEEEEIEQEEPSPVFGKCARCNFVDSSGVFVCSICGYVFPVGNSRRKADKYDEDKTRLEPEAVWKGKKYSNNIDDMGVEDDGIKNEAAQDNLSEIIRCPQCNEINRYSSGSCWQCGLHFELDEVT